MFVEYLGYFYMIYQRLTTTSIRSHQRYNFKQPINEPMILWGIEKNISFRREEIISEKNNIHPQPLTQYSLYKYWVWIFKTYDFTCKRTECIAWYISPLVVLIINKYYGTFSVVARLGSVGWKPHISLYIFILITLVAINYANP